MSAELNLLQMLMLQAFALHLLEEMTTYPDGSTRVEKDYQDGSLYEISGTAVHGQRYSYAMVEHSNAVTVSPMWGNGTVVSAAGATTMPTLDWVGGTYRTWSPSPSVREM